jgi:hypothetical protein
MGFSKPMADGRENNEGEDSNLVRLKVSCGLASEKKAG